MYTVKNLRKTFEGEIYHICNKSIANYQILIKPSNAKKFIYTLDFYNSINLNKRFSDALRENKYRYKNILLPKKSSLVKFFSFIIMPDHYHILIKALHDNVISKYISNVENSFSRYFNLRNKRKGPLWQSRFRIVRIETIEQLLHVTRYIHLNPTTAGLVNKPEDWQFSSYKDYINNEKILKEIMTELTIKDPKVYKKFCEDNIDYQRKLKKIKKLMLE